MINPDTEYEKLAREVYEEILKADGFETVKVEHNTNIEGKSTQKHQIDVYWEFKAAGITHRVAVECKNYTSTITVGKVRDFAAALDDIGNIQGIFITKTGYQKGAKKFADYKGIELKMLREPTDEDLTIVSGVRTIRITGTMYYLDNVRPSLKLDYNWIEANTSLREGDPYEIAAMSNDIIIIDENGNTRSTWQDLQKDLSQEFEEFEDRYKEFDLLGHYITWPNCQYGKLKLEKIAFLYNMRASKHISRFEGKFAAKAVLEDIRTGEIHLHQKETKIEVYREQETELPNQ